MASEMLGLPVAKSWAAMEKSVKKPARRKEAH
jgi:hypothetical protein